MNTREVLIFTEAFCGLALLAGGVALIISGGLGMPEV
jgi:hypothetical protein